MRILLQVWDAPLLFWSKREVAQEPAITYCHCIKYIIHKMYNLARLFMSPPVPNTTIPTTLPKSTQTCLSNHTCGIDSWPVPCLGAVLQVNPVLVEPCSKPFLDLNAISRPYACTLRNTYATTIGAYAEDYGQHNLTHCLRDPVSWRKMTPHCSVSLRIPMAQGRYLDVFLLSGFLFESITQGFQYLIASTSRSYK